MTYEDEVKPGMYDEDHEDELGLLEEAGVLEEEEEIID